ncbi:DUF3667 domain-containing protein [Reichenbachiella ulvae]|uniref:DUF3667 domain-containing protein n=1 Tax=Reichenbachiella ulvae TaxID=2980104 RepID=A0ABT3CRJ1_9BACT|nr:DUF3667 domain-containing protein [Reichenbachiella ulvae]MCV9386100.1 DUF3667 domain-containing protein [Reichenbachiella ulvae]
MTPVIEKLKAKWKGTAPKLNGSSLKSKLPSLKRRRHPSTECLNCRYEYDLETNYCPRCGQENNHNKLSFGTIVADFFHNYLSFDSKFSNSLIPFLFKPGKLTLLFVEGRRAAYVNPIRLYLIISLLFFFVFNMISREFMNRTSQEIAEAAEVVNDSTRSELKKVFAEAQIDSSAISNTMSSLDSIQNSDKGFSTSLKTSSENGFLSDVNINRYLELRKDKNFSPEQLLDSLNTDSLTTFERKMVLQAIKTDQAPMDLIVSRVMQNLPMMMLLIIPIMALVLKLFYLSREYYFTHIIHLLHLHSFAYIVYSLAALLLLLNANEVFNNWMLTLTFPIVNIYCFLSFKKVYQQPIGKTFIKFLLTGFIYTWVLTFAVLLEMLLSVATI